MSSPTATDDPLSRALIRMRHGGKPWAACATDLGQSTEALKRRARRLRDSGQWRLANGKPARGAPVKGQLGRPRKDVRSVSVSPRFSPEVAAEIRYVAQLADMREGEVVSEALYRACTRAHGKQVSSVPLGLQRANYVLPDSPRTATLSVNLPSPVHDDFMKTLSDEAKRMTAIADAVHELLRDLGYRLA